MIYKILIVATNVQYYKGTSLKTGLWLSELTHIYDAALKKGWEVTIASPRGGSIPVDPESLRFFSLDTISKQYWRKRSFRSLLENSISLADTAEQAFDVLYLAGGHGAMYDFVDNNALENRIARQYESCLLVASICHGTAGLLNVKLSSGEYLIKGKKTTGFNWFEERLAGRRKKVPFNLEAALKERYSAYKKALIPMTSFVVKDGNLITGQNPFSSKEMADTIIRALIDTKTSQRICRQY